MRPGLNKSRQSSMLSVCVCEAQCLSPATVWCLRCSFTAAVDRSACKILCWPININGSEAGCTVVAWSFRSKEKPTHNCMESIQRLETRVTAAVSGVRERGRGREREEEFGLSIDF